MEALVKYQEPGSDEIVRDGLIQRFEFTYEQAHVTLRRHLESASSGGDKIDRMSFPALIRTASEQGPLLNGWDVWEKFRDARNLTSHTYHETSAINVVRKIPLFAGEVAYLVDAMKGRELMNPTGSVSATSPIHLQLHEWEIVAAILRAHVPRKAVWAFGSRATERRVKRFSDLDLAVEGRLDMDESYGLEEDFDQSSLPIKVDVVQLGLISSEFRARIEKDYVLVQEGALSADAAGLPSRESVSA